MIAAPHPARTPLPAPRSPHRTPLPLPENLPSCARPSADPLRGPAPPARFSDLGLGHAVGGGLGSRIWARSRNARSRRQPEHRTSSAAEDPGADRVRGDQLFWWNRFSGSRGVCGWRVRVHTRGNRQGPTDQRRAETPRSASWHLLERVRRSRLGPLPLHGLISNPAPEKSRWPRRERSDGSEIARNPSTPSARERCGWGPAPPCGGSTAAPHPAAPPARKSAQLWALPGHPPCGRPRWRPPADRRRTAAWRPG